MASREVGKEIKGKIDAILSKLLKRESQEVRASDVLPHRAAKRQKLSGDAPVVVSGPEEDIRDMVNKTLDQVQLPWEGNDCIQQLKDVLVKGFEERPKDIKLKPSPVLDMCAGPKGSCLLCKLKQTPCRLEEHAPCGNCTNELCLRVAIWKGVKGKKWIFTEMKEQLGA